MGGRHKPRKGLRGTEIVTEKHRDGITETERQQKDAEGIKTY